MSDISWLKTILVALIPGGQLYGRVALLDCSLDKPWLLIPIFFFPPFSFIFAILMKMGKIKKGKCGKPYDWNMLIPIITRIVIMLFTMTAIDYITEDTIIKSIILATTLVIQFIALIIPFAIRTYKECKNICMNNIGKIISDALVVGAIAQIFDLVLEPMYGFGYAIAYVLINIYNQPKMEEYCKNGNKNISRLENAVVSVFAGLFIVMNILNIGMEFEEE
jgi:hypothetical protein